MFLSVLFLIFRFGALRMTSATDHHRLDRHGDAASLRFSSSPTSPDRHAGSATDTRTPCRHALLHPDHRTLHVPRTFRQFDAKNRSTIAAVELKEAYKRIEELAELDELTGSFNRRCIMRMLDDEIARAHRSGKPCSIALIDLDWFKRINDALRPSDRRRGAPDLRHHRVRQHPRHRPVRPLWRRGIPAGAARHDRRRRRAHCSTGCARSSPISTGARSRPACR